MADSQLAHQAGCQMRARYLHLKQKLVGSRYQLPDEWIPEDRWNDLGLRCLELQARPADLIDAIFRMGKKHRNGPFPNMLAGMASKAWELWLRDRPEAKLQARADVQERVLDNRTSDDEYYAGLLSGAIEYVTSLTRGAKPGTEAFEAAVLNASTPIPSWIRLILAPGNLDVWYEYGVEACRTYRNHPEMVQWLAEAGYPIMDILNRPTPPEPEYFKMLRANGLDPADYYR